MFAKMPVYSGLAIGIFFAGLGLPGLCGFIGEVLVVLSAWKYSYVLAVISASVVILTAGYILWTIQRVYLGAEYKGPHGEALTPISMRELAIATPLLVMAVVPARDQHAVFLWLMGDLANPDITPLKVGFTAAVVVLCGAVLLLLARPLDLIALGEESAFHLGLSVEKFKLLVLVCAALATASVVALAGPIGFVGIVVPHALRRVIGPRHLPLLAAAALGGAALVAVGDTLVRVTADYFNMPIVPVGVFTALIGAPYFLVILRKKGY